MRAYALSANSSSPTADNLFLAIHVALVYWGLHLCMSLCPHQVHLSTRYLFLTKILSSFNFAMRSDLPGVPDASSSLITALVNVSVRKV